jgi:hypothetical protein
MEVRPCFEMDSSVSPVPQPEIVADMAELAGKENEVPDFTLHKATEEHMFQVAGELGLEPPAVVVPPLAPRSSPPRSSSAQRMATSPVPRRKPPQPHASRLTTSSAVAGGGSRVLTVTTSQPSVPNRRPPKPSPSATSEAPSTPTKQASVPKRRPPQKPMVPTGGTANVVAGSAPAVAAATTGFDLPQIIRRCERLRDSGDLTQAQLISLVDLLADSRATHTVAEAGRLHSLCSSDEMLARQLLRHPVLGARGMVRKTSHHAAHPCA